MLVVEIRVFACLDAHLELALPLRQKRWPQWRNTATIIGAVRGTDSSKRL
jgi:hypothetical protein